MFALNRRTLRPLHHGVMRRPTACLSKNRYRDFSRARFAEQIVQYGGGDALMGNTRSHPEHDG